MIVKTKSAEPDGALDLAVIGGGMAGLYVACKADEERYPRRALFEAAPKLGGRVQSVVLKHGEASFCAELGAMRFEWGLQPKFQELVRELGLKIKDFVPYSAPKSRSDIHYPLLPAEEVCLREQGGSLLVLWRAAILRVLREVCRFLPCHLRFLADLEGSDDWLREVGEPHFAWLRTQAVFPIGRRGPAVKLCDLGIWTLMRCGGLLSGNALSMLMKEGTFYHFLERNINAAESIVFWIRVFQSNASIKTIHGGVATVVDRLATSATRRGTRIHLGHRLTSLSPVVDARSQERLVALDFAGEEGFRCTVLARQVVLAVPQQALRPLSWVFPKDVRASLDSVIPMAMLKCFFLVKDPWWRDDRKETHAGTETCPSREIHYSSSGDRSVGMVLVYCDQPSYDFWAPLRGDDAMTKRLRQAAFASFMGIEEERVVDSLLVDWTQVPHQGAAAYFWKAGARVYDVMERLSGFDFDGQAESAPPRLHICGCAYSDFQGFIEGALRTASSALQALHTEPAACGAAA